MNIDLIKAKILTDMEEDLNQPENQEKVYGVFLNGRLHGLANRNKRTTWRRRGDAGSALKRFLKKRIWWEFFEVMQGKPYTETRKAYMENLEQMMIDMCKSFEIKEIV